ASNSVIKISTLSVPIPVLMTEIFLPLKWPVWVMNSRLFISNSTSSKCWLTLYTRPGSPTAITTSAICFGNRLRWYTLPSLFRIKSVSETFGIQLSAYRLSRISKNGFAFFNRCNHHRSRTDACALSNSNARHNGNSGSDKGFRFNHYSCVNNASGSHLNKITQRNGCANDRTGLKDSMITQRSAYAYLHACIYKVAMAK